MVAFVTRVFILLILAILALTPGAIALSLEFVTNYALPDGAFGISLVGSLAYIANDTSGLVIIDITDPYGPFTVGSISTPGFTRSAFVAGNYAYVADGDSGLQVIDI